MNEKHTEYTKQEWKIAVLEDDLAALQEEIERLKASRDRLRRFHFAVFAAMDGRIGQELGEVSTQELDELERVADEAEAALLPGDLADADPAPDAGQEVG